MSQRRSSEVRTHRKQTSRWTRFWSWLAQDRYRVVRVFTPIVIKLIGAFAGLVMVLVLDHVSHYGERKGPRPEGRVSIGAPTEAD
jgi:hypothetical protein